MLIGRLPSCDTYRAGPRNAYGMRAHPAGVLVLAHEQQRRVPLLPMVDVPPARLRVGRGRALRLPMEEPIADRVVLVHRRGRVRVLGLVQRDEEGVDLSSRPGAARPRGSRAACSSPSAPARRGSRPGCIRRAAASGPARSVHELSRAEYGCAPAGTRARQEIVTRSDWPAEARSASSSDIEAPSRPQSVTWCIDSRRVPDGSRSSIALERTRESRKPDLPGSSMWASRRNALGKLLSSGQSTAVSQPAVGEEPRPQASFEQLVQRGVEVLECLPDRGGRPRCRRDPEGRSASAGVEAAVTASRCRARAAGRRAPAGSSSPLAGAGSRSRSLDRACPSARCSGRGIATRTGTRGAGRR
jgi:hypothetical protein